MDVLKLVVLLNGLYGLSVMFLLSRVYGDYKNKIESKDKRVSILHVAFNPVPVTMIFMLMFLGFIKNGHIFNEYVPASFILQFSLQFFYLIGFILPKKEWARMVAAIALAVIFIVAAFNGLVEIPRKLTQIELTINDLNKLSDDVETFNSNLSEKMSEINKNMTAVV